VNELKAEREAQGVIVSASKAALTTNGGSSPVGNYLTKHGIGANGTFIKFAKDGVFRKQMDDAEIPKGTTAVLIYDQIRVGWIKFMGKGNQPTRHMGPVFEGFVPPDRESLGDLDEAEWEEGLSGRAVDPWQFQVLLPLQDTQSGELLIFGTSSITGRRACDNLISLCGRMQRSEPDFYPVVRLDVSGFQHRDERVGWVKTPAFTRVGKAPKSDVSAAITSAADDMSDEIPF
jgi:hypothetical protein